MKIIVRAVVAVIITAAVLAGCAREPQPESGLLPTVAFPRGSTLDDSYTTDDDLRVESWNVPLGFDEVADYFRETLPIGRQFDDLDYRGEESGIDEDGAKYAEWTWDNEQMIYLKASEMAVGQDETFVFVGVG